MANSIKFACVGDWGNGNQNQYLLGTLISSLLAENEIEFICGLGDNFYPRGISTMNFKENIKEKFSNPFINCQAPFYMVLGNHDYLGNVTLETHHINKIDDRWIMPNRYYDFIMKVNNIKAHFIVRFQ